MHYFINFQIEHPGKGQINGLKLAYLTKSGCYTGYMAIVIVLHKYSQMDDFTYINFIKVIINRNWKCLLTQYKFRNLHKAMFIHITYITFK